MGYRSDVAIAIYGDSEKLNELKEFYENEVNQLDDDNKEYLVDLLDDSRVNTEKELFSEDMFLFLADNVKWYDTYPIVILFNKLYTHAQTLSLTGEYVIIGEEFDDCEYDHFGDDCEYLLGIERTISIRL